MASAPAKVSCRHGITYGVTFAMLEYSMEHILSLHSQRPGSQLNRHKVFKLEHSSYDYCCEPRADASHPSGISLPCWE